MSGRRREDFITERAAHKNKSSAGRKGGEWKEEGRLLLPGGSTKNFTAGARGVGAWEKCEDFVTGRWPHSRNVKLESTRE